MRNIKPRQHRLRIERTSSIDCAFSISGLVALWIASQSRPFSFGSGCRSRTVRQTISKDSILSVFCLGVSCAGSKLTRPVNNSSTRSTMLQYRYHLFMPGLTWTNRKISPLPCWKSTLMWIL